MSSGECSFISWSFLATNRYTAPWISGWLWYQLWYGSRPASCYLAFGQGPGEVADRGELVQEPDRFGRSLRKLIVLVNGLRERSMEFVFIRESINVTTRGGELVFPVFGAVAELERDLILGRTMVGLEAARACDGKSDARV